MSVINVENVKKVYPLYNNKKDRLKEAFSISGKKYHKDFYALNDISFQIEKGECVGLIGLNGSGKSTILKILAGVLTQSEGKIDIEGKVSALLELGAGFNPEYTGFENIYLNAMMMGFSKKETDEKLQDILDFADIGEFINQPVKVYSSGMFVRLAFAIAINVEPDILIVDEALSVGDVFFQQKCYKKIKELAGKSTVLIVSHDLNAMTKFCKRIIVMNKGNLEFDGEPNEAITQYFRIKQGQVKENLSLTSNKSNEVLNLEDYKIPKQNEYSGKMDVIIEKYFYSINDEPFAEYCQRDDEIHISLIVDSNKDIDDLIVGYQTRDKYGNEVFGQTSLTSEVEQFQLEKGKNIISFKVTWPEIREGDYFITLGIGEGIDVLNQTEECWINNAIHVVASTIGKTIFGVFNNSIEDYTIERVK
ncbi:ABC transporter ATP-binding protein [Clostridium saccharobutylicum]|uniref:ABC transporter protein AbcA n=1 Tax=Clostridium saccharobutylicum DSM 13864 TaxID=1345695 RepID=U5MX90_CLOSA|nr:ABC transporter ATP-binding protein [Clostridium saccharobutylicum]AGX45163.1 ABC transporter protein AbcA [Clostridium saccharobutylicum DSM 13864]AQR92442.1 teichoic acids export ATP-binding protein TagH [Clostridium saccharobutylicum]AQS02345.1 teichoic acids export ATP-binding protein TagH [Clostridium saccharobutylicum]AQS11949.1 teichoic acids export ATP-binding protein TagH [Clostridium saccharobutylicum]AQS16328.1 teichoic acids export ATP-binding protein TagH [Clostridium saccharob